MNLKTIKKKLKVGFSNTGGRNHKGRITHFHHGKKHKQIYRKINFKINNEEGVIKTIEYDPNRTSFISLVQLINGNYKYILTPQGVKIGDFINTDKNYKTAGNSFLLKSLPIGTFVHNIELRPNEGSKLIRAAGSYAQVIQQQKKYVKVRLASQEQRLILNTCMATIGKVSNVEKKYKKLNKAGNNIWKGIRPTVRGVAMNPVDHPHGGGQGKTSGGRCSVTPWGKLTKNKKTVLKKNKFIILETYNKKYNKK
jgi:large subunit ribosomal protein L2